MKITLRDPVGYIGEHEPDMYTAIRPNGYREWLVWLDPREWKNMPAPNNETEHDISVKFEIDTPFQHPRKTIWTGSVRSQPLVVSFRNPDFADS